MARTFFFKSLADFITSSQREWLVATPDDLEVERRAAYQEGVLAMERGDYDGAIPHLKKAVDARQDRKEAYYLLAQCYEAVNMRPLAKKTYERLLRLDYNFRDARARLQALDRPPAAALNAAAAALPTAIVDAEDRYNILETLHVGQYARVYRVHDNLLGRTVVLKQIEPHYPDRAEFFQQMQTHSALEHPNIVRIYDLDVARGQITLEYVPGSNLRQVLQLKRTLAPHVVTYIAIQLVNALHRAHTNKILHEALTPEHVLVTRECQVKLTAFRAPESFQRIKQVKDPYVYLYVPPELFRQPEAFSAAANIYSLGVMVYEMLVGHTPFRLRQINAYVKQQTPLTYDESALPPGFQPILRRCLATSPTDRSATIREIGEALLAFHKQAQQDTSHEKDLQTFQDYLLMAWADGALTPPETEFLAGKRQELHITDAEAQTLERAVQAELKTLLTQLA